MIAIEVNKGFLDLLENTQDEFYITRQVNDVFNLNTRNADYTRTIRLPNSKGNREKLEILSDNTKPLDRLPCSLFISNVAFAINSDLLINSIEQYYIECTLLIGATSFFTLVPEDSIRKLDLIDYNFTWDLTGVAAINTETEGAIFGKSIYFDMPNVREQLIIGGSPGTSLDVFADLWIYGFSFYIKTLIEKIVINAGFSFDDSLIIDIENYDNLVLMCPMFGLLDQDLEASIQAYVDQESPPQTVTGTTAHADYVAITDPGGLWNNTNDEFAIGATVPYNIVVNYDVDITVIPLTGPCELRIVNDTTVLKTIVFNSSGSYSGTIEINELLASGSVLFVELFATAGVLYADSELILNLDGNDFSISDTQPLFSRDLKVADHLPDISQRTLITNFLALSNIVLIADDPSKSVILKSFDDIFYKMPVDLTQHYDKSRPFEFSYTPDNYYKNSGILFNNYSSLLRTDLLFEVVIDNENLAIRGNILSFDFEGSDVERLYSRDLTYQPAYGGTLSNETGLNGTVGLATFTITGTAPDFKPGDFIDVGIDTMRIATKTGANSGTIAGLWSLTIANVAWDLMKFTKTDLGGRIGWVDQSVSIALATSDGDMSIGAGSSISCRDIYFSDNLKPEDIYNTYYKNLLDTFDKFIRLKCWLVLDAITFKNLDLTKSIYLQQFGSTYYVNKLDQWRPNGLVRADLIRINKENG